MTLCGMQTTIRQLARHSGFSKSTVAAALKGDPRYSAETRARVTALAARLNYAPNPLIVANMAHVRNSRRRRRDAITVGYLSNIARSEVLRANSIANMGFSGAVARGEELGFRMDLLDYESPGMTLPRMRKVLESRGIVGLIIAPHEQPQFALDLHWEKFAVVCIGYSISSPRFDRVGFDHYEAQREACEKAWERGYRRIGLVMSRDFDDRVMHLSKGSYQCWQSERAVESLPVLILDENTPRQLVDWTEKHRPDCVITHGVSAEKLFGSSSIRPMPAKRFAAPVYTRGYETLCGYDYSVRRLAETAVDLLASKLYRNERGLPKTRQTVLVLG